MSTQAMPAQVSSKGLGRILLIIIGGILLLVVIAAGLYFLLRPTPPAGTFPDQVGQYKLKRRPDHTSFNSFDITPQDSWWSVYERGLGDQTLVKGVENSIDVQYDVLVFSSPEQAKQSLESFIKKEVAGRQTGYSAQIVQQGSRPNKATESYVVLNKYFADKDKGNVPKLTRTDAIWTEGPMVIIAESSPNDDQRIIERKKALGMTEEAAVDFMKNYPN